MSLFDDLVEYGSNKVNLKPYHLIKDKGEKVLITGSGFGHGVRLCQFGAKELALRGFDYKQILNHYFPSFKLTKLY